MDFPPALSEMYPRRSLPTSVPPEPNAMYSAHVVVRRHESFTHITQHNKKARTHTVGFSLDVSYPLTDLNKTIPIRHIDKSHNMHMSVHRHAAKKRIVCIIDLKPQSIRTYSITTLLICTHTYSIQHTVE